MAIELATAYVSLTASARGISDSISRELSGPVSRAANDAGDSAGRGFVSRFTSGFGGIAAAVGGAFAAREVVDFFTSAVDAGRESARVAAQTAQVISTTGGAANVSAGQVADYAESLASLTGVDDELIQQGQNVLLTFTQVRNEVGEGNDIFDRGTAAALDMSAALGQDMQASIVQVGKALNDPIQGVSALRRVGVQLTDQQEASIRTFVEQGDILSAQRVILDELGTQFGGTAAAVATPMDRLKVTFGNLQEQLGGVLIPIIDRVAVWLSDNLPGAIETAQTTIAPFIADFIRGVSDLWESAQPVVEFFQEHWREALIGAGIILGLLTAPISTVIAALVFAYTHFEGFRNVVDSVVGWLVDNVPPAFEAVKEAAMAAFEWIAENVVPIVQAVVEEVAEAWGELVGWVREHWDAISEAIGHVVNVIETLIADFVEKVQLGWQLFGDNILGIASIVWDQIRNVVSTAVDLVRGIIETAVALINGDWGEAWEAFKGVLSTAFDYVKETISNAMGVIGEVIGGAMTLIGSVWSDAWGHMRSLLDTIWDGAVGVFEGVMNGIIGGIEAGINLAIDAVNVLIRAFNGIPLVDSISEIGEVNLGRIGSSNSRPNVVGTIPTRGAFDSGGIVPGPIGAPAWILAHSGETVLPTHKDPSAGTGGDTFVLNGITDVAELADRLNREKNRRVMVRARS